MLKRWGIRIVVCSFMLVLLLAPAHDAFASAAAKRVLVLYTEDKELPAQKLTDMAIRRGFKSNQSFAIELFTEYMDLSRFAELQHKESAARFLAEKYSGAKPDLIITVYPVALDFMAKYGHRVFSGIPIVASGIYDSMAKDLENTSLRQRVTGVIFQADIGDIIPVARMLRPGTKRVALVGGNSVTDKRNWTIFRNVLRQYEPELEVMELAGLAMPGILERIGSLSPESIVLYSSVSMDGAGHPFTPREALSLVSRASNVPVFGVFDSYLGYGIVGGRLVSFEYQGEKAAELALRILAGESPAGIPFAVQGATEPYLFDWRELKRWGISEKALPAGSIVKFKPSSIWEDHRGVILGGVSFMIIQGLLITGLMVNLQKRKHAEDTLRRGQKEYQDLAGQLLTAQETERGRLARELHDDLSQRLAALAIEIGILERASPSTSQAAAATVHKITEELVNLSGSVHDISRRLHPSILEDLGLVDAIRSECDGFARRDQIEVQFESRNCPPRPPIKIGLCFYRVIQESLRNIAKHARATRIDVSLTGGNDMLHLLVKDNGRGFDPGQVSREHGLGLTSMRERVRLIQGDISIRSQVGHGTVIEIHAPLQQETEGRPVGSAELL